MADMTLYAWSTFPVYEADDNGNVRATKTIRPGEEISAGDLGVEDEEFEVLIVIGAVRPQQYPDLSGYDGSPVEYVRDQLRAAASDEFMSVLPFGSVPPISVAPPGSMPITPIMDERATAAVNASGFDPNVAPDELSVPDDAQPNEEDTQPPMDAVPTTSPLVAGLQQPTTSLETNTPQTGEDTSAADKVAATENPADEEKQQSTLGNNPANGS